MHISILFNKLCRYLYCMMTFVWYPSLIYMLYPELHQFNSFFQSMDPGIWTSPKTSWQRIQESRRLDGLVGWLVGWLVGCYWWFIYPDFSMGFSTIQTAVGLWISSMKSRTIIFWSLFFFGTPGGMFVFFFWNKDHSNLDDPGCGHWIFFESIQILDTIKKGVSSTPSTCNHNHLRGNVMKDGSLGGDGWCWCTNLLHLILTESNQVPFNYIIWDPNDPNHLRSGATRYSMVRYFGDSVLHDGQMMWDKNLCSKAKTCHGAAHAENMDSACLGWFKLILQMMLLLVMTILGCTIIHH